MIYQSSHLISSLSVYENIRMPLDLEQNSVFDEPFFQAIVQTLQIEHFLELYPNQLSQGQKQKVCIARALITKPEILLADEPTAHLDNESAQEFMLLLKKVQILFARTIFMATHDFSLAKQADRILYMKDGKVCPYEIS
jgi:putative ABC transport system ATP-binding protein